MEVRAEKWLVGMGRGSTAAKWHKNCEGCIGDKIGWMVPELRRME